MSALALLSVSWTGELQQSFLQAVKKLDGLTAPGCTAKPIWELMNWKESELSVEQVANHLERERLGTDAGSALPSLPFPWHLTVCS